MFKPKITRADRYQKSDESHVELADFIRTTQALAFTLQEIANLVDEPAMRRLTLQRRIALMDERIAFVEQKISALRERRSSMRSLQAGA